MVNLILFGPPGSGKGTQAARLVEKYNFFHISTGDMFRYELKNDTDLGKLARSYMNKGELVPDEVTIKMLEKRVDDNPDVNGFILDGFPRTIRQAEALDAFLSSKNQEVSALLALNVSDEELTERLLNRAKTSGRADDADVNIIKNRIEVYKATTTPVAEFYDKKDKTTYVDGIGSIDDIAYRLTSIIDSF